MTLSRLALLASLMDALLVTGRVQIGPRAIEPRCEPVGTFADGKTPRHVRHVSVTGDDARGNGSATAPFRTISRAAQGIEPGTAIHVHAGIHRGGIFLNTIHGTAQEPIWIMGAPSEARPVIEGGNEGLRLVKPRHLVIQRLEIRGTADNGINADDGDELGNSDAARHVVFRELNIHDIGLRPSGIANCLKLAGVNDVTVVNSRFARCGNGPDSGAVGVGGVGVQRATVAFNEFVANGYGGIQFKGGSADITIAANRFTNTGWRGVNMGGSMGTSLMRPPPSGAGPIAQAARISVVSNVFDGSETAAAFAGCVECTFVHNTVVNPTKWVLRILQESVTSDGYAFAPAKLGVVTDNIFYFRRADLNTGEDINVGPDTDANSFLISGNLWFAHDQPGDSAPRVSHLRGAAVMNALVGRDPRFVNAGAGDFRLLEGSPAIRPDGPLGTLCVVP